MGCNLHVTAQTGTNKISEEIFEFTIIASIYFSILFTVEARYFLTELTANLGACDGPNY